MKKLHLSQHGPQVGASTYSCITIDDSKSCASTSLKGSDHNWPYNPQWLILTPEASKLWQGERKMQDGFEWGLLKREEDK